MALYRVKQFYWSIITKISSEDERYIKAYLSKQELDMFEKLPDYEKKHAINVAKDVEKLYNIEGKNKVMLIKAALLHDIGKTLHRLTPVDKSFMVILDKISKGSMKKLSYIKKVNIYYNHADIGYSMLKKYGYEERFLYLVKNHHNDNIIWDKELDVLKKCDSRN